MKKLNKIQHYVQKVFSNELFWIMFICFTVRNLLFQHQSHILYNTDSVTYYHAASQIFKGLIDPGRPPVYPILIKVSELIDNAEPFKFLVLLQHALSFASIVPFFLLSREVSAFKPIRIIMVLTYGVFPILLPYNNALFAESILISCLTGYLYLICRHIKYPGPKKAVFINILLFFMVMIKPVCLVLYGVILFFWLFRLIQKKDLILKTPILYSYLLSLVLLIGYCGINKVQNDSFSISTVGHDNKFINVIFSGAYRSIPDEDFVNTIDSTIYKGHYYTVYYLNNDHNKYHDGFKIFPLEFMSHWDMEGVYNTPSNPLGYSANNISPYLKQAASTLTYWAYTCNKAIEFLDFKLFYINGAIIYAILLLEFLFLMFFFFRKKNLDELKSINLLTAVALLCGFFLAGVNDGTYPRVLLPLLPFLIISFFSLLDHVAEMLRRNPILAVYKFKKIEGK